MNDCLLQEEKEEPKIKQSLLEMMVATLQQTTSDIFTTASYNCRGLPKSSFAMMLRPDISDIVNTSDIICLQETWFSKQDLGIINGLNHRYHGTGVSSTDLRDSILMGHPPCGTAFLWKESFNKNISTLRLRFRLV